jgi:hypothetical protein
LLFPVVLATVVVTLPDTARATSTTCNTTVVCAEYVNVSSGVAIHGEANRGIGVRGTSVTNTGFYGASGSGIGLTPGVEGESTYASGSDAAGGFGLAFLAGRAAPNDGVEAYGVYAGVMGETTSSGGSSSGQGAGLIGLDVAAGATYNYGVVGTSAHGTGGLFSVNGQPTLGYVGSLPIGLYAVAETDGRPLAVGIVTESNSIPLVASNSHDGTTAQLLPTGDLLTLHASKGSVTIDKSGNAMFSGSVTSNGGSYVVSGLSGEKRAAYASKAAAPEIEDVGEAMLVNGRAAVTIDAALRDSIDTRRTYHVFVTPDGDCKGLYVAERTPSGFVVRELQGGRSTLDFEYRIVAKPAGDDGERLARADASPTMPDVRPHGETVPAFATSEARLRQRLGSQGYARALGDLSRRLDGK